MAKLCSTEDLLGQDDMELLVWHHRLDHCYFKYLNRLSKRGIISSKIINIRKSRLVSSICLKSPTRGHVGPKVNA